MKYILREITPRANNRLFITTHYPDNPMDFPIHFHEDFELCLTLNVQGKRIVGNMEEHFDQKDLVLISPNVLHCYKRSEAYLDVCCDVFIVQFSKDLPDLKFIGTEELSPIKKLLDRASTGIRFSRQTIDRLQERIFRLSHTDPSDFAGVLLFLEILYELAVSPDQVILSTSAGKRCCDASQSHSRRINKIIRFAELNYSNHITLEEVGRLVGMSPSSVSRFFRKRTQQKFWDYLNNLRVDRVAQLMIETDKSISEICYECGFNNISNFNRVFRERMQTTPSEYRRKVKATMIPK